MPRSSNVHPFTPWITAIAMWTLGARLCAGEVIYFNDTPNSQMATASRPDASGFEIESADDFVLTRSALITNATFTGLFVGSASAPTVIEVVIEIYRVFPTDSDTTRTPAVPTRNNSPSDVEFVGRDSAVAGDLSFATSTLSTSFTAANSVEPGGIPAPPLPSPLPPTGGDGAVTGTEVAFSIDFSSAMLLPPGHYFFVPQVELGDGDTFLWLSASRPVSGAGTTPFPAGFTDLQTWTRDEGLDPDWLRVGTDIVGPQDGVTRTFNAAFSLSGTVPEPGSLALVGAGLVAAWWYRRRRRR
ncbi:MAG TPA: PEP-CTERM sorting domain-containing protein [Casimicrobiaceae bacterium]|nr:PEP-CTERM sorting domain-containing protein [Casimicrobiaceae bacterium]